MLHGAIEIISVNESEINRIDKFIMVFHLDTYVDACLFFLKQYTTGK